MRTTRIRTARRVADVIGDVLLVAWAVLWFVVSRSLRGLIDSIMAPISRLGASTGTVAGRLDDTAEALRDIAFVGDGLAAPFPGLASAIRDLGAQINSQVVSVDGWSPWAVAMVFVVPTMIAAAWYIPWRIRRVRESAAARGLLLRNPSLDLFALRALSTAHLGAVAQISSDAAAAWRAQDPTVIHRLAGLELRRVGVELAAIGSEPQRTPVKG